MKNLHILPTETKKYPIGGYALGSYYCTCANCSVPFFGDKRAVQCEPCAIKTTQEEPKQETVEEAAERLYPLLNVPDGSGVDWTHRLGQNEGFLQGSKWQAERMYSEEDVINALHSVELKGNKNYSKIYSGMKEWFNQNKKF